MRFVLRLLLAIAVALGIGFGLSYYALTDGRLFGAVQIGAWTAWPDSGAPAPNPYTRGHIVRESALQLGRAEGLQFVATTDDCRATYDELRAKGVEFTQEPVEQPYGVDCALRDPFGNHIRITQPVQGPVEITDADRERWRAGAEVNQ